MQKIAYQTHSFDDYTLDLTRGCLLRGTEEVKLRPISFEALKYLIEHQGQLVSKADLIKAVWPDSFVTDDSLVQCLMEVRRALSDEAQQIIKTVPRRGYIFDREARENGASMTQTVYTEEVEGVHVVLEEEETNGHEAIETKAQGEKLSDLHKVSRVQRLAGTIKRHKIATATASVALAALVIAGVIFAKPLLTWWFKPPSIAVLPFVNATGDAALDYAGDGLTGGLIQSLSQINAPSKFPRLLVAPLFSVSTFKGRDIDPRNAGREMGVDFVLAGRITQSNRVLTVRVELIKVSDGSLVWSKQNSQYGLLSMELSEDIAQGVAQKLSLRLSDEERHRLTKRYTQNPAAYEAFLRGESLFWTFTPASMRKSAEYYQQAIELDPNFPLPYIQMGGLDSMQGILGLRPMRESFQKANEWWAKALQRDDSLESVRVLMLVQKFWLEWDWEGIERLGHRTGVYNDYLAAMGRLDESLANNKQWQAWAPTAALVTSAVGTDLYFLHRYDEAIEQYKKAITLDPDNWPAHFYLSFTYSHKGMHEEAIAEMNRTAELQENAPLSLAGLGYVYAVAGHRDEALKILNQLQERAAHGEYVSPLGIAFIHIGLGNRDEAFTWLDRAYEDRSSGMSFLKVEPIYEPLRSDPRFTNLLRRMRLQT